MKKTKAKNINSGHQNEKPKQKINQEHKTLEFNTNMLIGTLLTLGLATGLAIYNNPNYISNFLSLTNSLLNVSVQTFSQLTGYNSIGQVSGAFVYFQRVFSFTNICKDLWQNFSNKFFDKEDPKDPISTLDKTIKDTKAIAPLIVGGIVLNLVTQEGLKNSIIKTTAAGIFSTSFPQIGKFFQSTLLNKIAVNISTWESVFNSTSLSRFALAPLMTLSSLISLTYETYNNKYGRTIENTPKHKFMPLAFLQAETVACIQILRDGKIEPFSGLTSFLGIISALVKTTKIPENHTNIKAKEDSRIPASSISALRKDGKTWAESVTLTTKKGLGLI